MPESGYQGTVAGCRKPRVSTTTNRRRLARPRKEQMILNKKSEMVVKRTMQSSASSMSDMVKSPSRSMSSARPNVSVSKMEEKGKITTTRPTAQEIKEAAISKALAAAAKKPVIKEKKSHTTFRFKRVLLAVACASAAVFAIVYFVNLNAPNISLKVAAMQTGIEASYPSYVPRDFDLSDIISESGKVTLNFRNSNSGDAFSLIEEKSSWDSNALLNNFVKSEYGENYTAIREQGLTIYVSNSGDATWVNGGVIFKIKIVSGSLTKKQIKTIAVSL